MSFGVYLREFCLVGVYLREFCLVVVYLREFCPGGGLSEGVLSRWGFI